MKKICVMCAVAALAFGVVSSSFAQAAGPQGGRPGFGQGDRKGGPGGGMRRMGQMNDEMMSKLNLTAEQKKKMEALDKEMKAKMKAMRDKMGKPGQPGQPGQGQPPSDKDRKARMEQFKAMMEYRNAQMKKILTPSQFAQYEKMVKERMANFRRGGPNGPPPPGAKPGKGGKGGGG